MFDSGDYGVLVRAVGHSLRNAQPVKLPVAFCHLVFWRERNSESRRPRASSSGAGLTSALKLP